MLRSAPGQGHPLSGYGVLGDPEHLREELGDLLMQVYFHARIAQEAPADQGGFDIGDVAQGIADKLVRRHPHVFAGLDVAGASATGAVAGSAPRLQPAATARTRGSTNKLGVFIGWLPVVAVSDRRKCCRARHGRCGW